MGVSKNQPKPQPTINSYASKLRQRLTWVSSAGGLISASLTALVMFGFDMAKPDDWVFWGIAIASGAVVASLAALISLSVFAPMQTILHAIAHTAGEPVAGKIPNPHDEKYQKSGLATAIQTIYEKDQQATTEAPAQPSETSTNATATINRMHGSIVALDKNRKIVFSSAGAPTHSADDKLKLSLLFAGDNSLEKWIEHCSETAIKANRTWLRVPDRTADQKGQRFFDVYANYEKDSNPETVVTLVDMTNQYQTDEDDLNFIAFAAHELRGPITVIRGYLDVLQDELSDQLAADQVELFRRLNVSASRLSGYVNNILNTSKYDRRHLSVDLKPEKIVNIYAAIADDMALRASSQNRLLSVNLAADLPDIAADRGSLSEVISNLIDNAIKYSFEGGTIYVSAAKNGDFVDISVSDSGIGMGSDVLKNLFQKFYRSHRSRETVAGSGIGLYISKAIVESHGGTISVRSSEGKGSTFTVSIPTYASVADKLAMGGGNQQLISQGKGWIKNHSMYRG